MDMGGSEFQRAFVYETCRGLLRVFRSGGGRGLEYHIGH